MADVAGLDDTIAPRRRVMLWDYHVERVFVDALAAEGFDVVVSVDGRVDGVPHIALATLAFGGDAYPSARGDGAPLDPAFERAYARQLSRVGIEPGTRRLDLELGGYIEAESTADLARCHIARARATLSRYAIDEVWFTSVPHFGIDTAMAEAARLDGIPVLVTRQLPFSLKFLFEWRDAEGTRAPAVDAFSAPRVGAAALNLFYMAPRERRNALAAFGERSAALLLRLVTGDWKRLLRRAYRAALDRRRFGVAIALARLDPETRSMAARLATLLREWRRGRRARRITPLEAVTGPIVYFALHYEPEANADVYGAPWVTQTCAIEALHAALPDGWTILLKENPAQGFVRRSEAFYARLAALAMVAWVDDATPSDALIDRAAVSASLAGTVGYEALRVGKPCLYFGSPWYAGFPGAVAFSSGVDLAALADRVVERRALDAAVDALLARAGDGVVARRFDPLLAPAIDRAAVTTMTARSLATISRAARGVA